MTLKLKNTNFVNIKALFSWAIYIVVSNKFPLGKQGRNYVIGYKDAKKTPYSFCPRMSIYKRDSDKTKCMYFLIKDRRFFDKYSKIWKKVSNIIKKKKKRKENLSIKIYI